MTKRIAKMLDDVLGGKHKGLRRTVDWKLDFAGRNAEERAADGLVAMLAAEKPAFLPDEKIAFIRTVANLPELYSKAEMEALRAKAFYAEKGVVFNMTPDYPATLAVGLDARRAEVMRRIETADAEGRSFLVNALRGIDAVLDLADRYRAAAQKAGRREIAAALAAVPHGGAKTFPQALQFLRILHYALWCEGEYHNGLGRVDQYLYPYYQADLAAGRLTEGQALEWIEEFFVACNRDSDLYVGVQQGDNGQSLMLGGCDREGRDVFNALSRLFLQAARELKVIDPKVNLRVTSKTPLSELELATELTKAGIGFPQYANDDIVIPALVKWGYSLEDARDYSVAACWEFLIPGKGMDIPNIDAVSLPAVVDRVMRDSKAATFEGFLGDVRKQLFREADRIAEKLKVVKMLPGPFVSILCDGRVEAARDVCLGNRYNNFGIHGTGLAVAVDSLASIRKWVYDQKRLTLADFVKVLDRNFAGDDALLKDVRENTPKMGNGDETVDCLATRVLDDFAASFAGRHNDRGGIYRTGTGSAMYYIWHANELPASADGRLKGEPFPANYAPSLSVPVKGPVSVITSFTVPKLGEVSNGGPLTLEMHDSTFAQADGVEKVAKLVKYFIDRGGHQLQINAVNRDAMKDAQIHPERHRHLIVRVWGWSGYFVELDKPFQDQIIKRVELTA